MCGRFVRLDPKNLPQFLADLEELIKSAPRFNIPPSESIQVIRMKPGTRKLEVVHLRWGLIPSWAKDPKIGNKLANARADTIAEKPSFRTPFKKRRCLVTMDGFYEWDEKTTPRQPWYFSMKDTKPFCVAAIWDHWTNPEGKVIETCALITTDANELMSPIHHRMPVILDRKDYGAWLDTDVQDPTLILGLLRPLPPASMQAWPVSRIVNTPKNDVPDCIRPLKETS